jgi:hypothetical protein
MRLFDQRSDIGMGFMPTMWLDPSLSKTVQVLSADRFFRRT